eukprot:CAMPEP_0201900064 /NCGR_PEP_ID=MMETSP0902-20130614/51607_1 /ASSEMBLY_ACC=CAM_ASM_000551 /TAXON_ID=420261 /ORGANISM="Thalassiosira antarctica, Strain CCMP982" /LENGTH=73 /DNA_ID=CAMNT_0048433629 /DNA_START=69 /DNA_END=290 /DNA_ORIENTATION=+
MPSMRKTYPTRKDMAKRMLRVRQMGVVREQHGIFLGLEDCAVDDGGGGLLGAGASSSDDDDWSELLAFSLLWT